MIAIIVDFENMSPPLFPPTFGAFAVSVKKWKKEMPVELTQILCMASGNNLKKAMQTMQT